MYGSPVVALMETGSLGGVGAGGAVSAAQHGVACALAAGPVLSSPFTARASKVYSSPTARSVTKKNLCSRRYDGASSQAVVVGTEVPMAYRYSMRLRVLPCGVLPRRSGAR